MNKKTALLSVSDKTGIVDFAKDLVRLGYRILSTGGTLAKLRDAGVEVTPVDEVTDFPECLDGRVKTLHPKIHGAILGIRSNEHHREEMTELGIGEIDLVAVNLYPFKNTVLSGAPFEDIVENIDIGGPSMVRSAAKNHQFVYIVTDADDYGRVVEAIEMGDDRLEDTLRYELAVKAFEHTANYDAMIATYFRDRLTKDVSIDEGVEAVQPSKTLTLTFEQGKQLRYGENPHQRAMYYKEPFSTAGQFDQLQGKEMSFNNYADLTAALNGVAGLTSPACFAVKHAMPCGVAEGSTVLDAYQKAYSCDPLSIFGGIVALNAPVDKATAEEMVGIFLEVVAAPDFDDEALEVLKRKKNLRVIRVPSVDDSTKDQHSEGRIEKMKRLPEYDVFQKVSGGILYQDADEVFSIRDAECVTKRTPTEKEYKELEFAWKVCMNAKSNAVVVVNNGATIGIGQGQVSRVFASENAVKNAGSVCKIMMPKNYVCEDSVAASDAFFPFADALETLVKAGVTAVVQPGGSKGDPAVIDFANKNNVAMLFTGRRHFRHTY